MPSKFLPLYKTVSVEWLMAVLGEPNRQAIRKETHVHVYLIQQL